MLDRARESNSGIVASAAAAMASLNGWWHNESFAKAHDVLARFWASKAVIFLMAADAMAASNGLFA